MWFLLNDARLSMLFIFFVENDVRSSSFVFYHRPYFNYKFGGFTKGEGLDLDGL